MKKKILFLNWRDSKHPAAGGAEQATLMHALAWQAAGYEITWFSSQAGELPEKEIYKKIGIIRKGYYVFGVQLAAFLYLLKNKHKYDLVVDQIHGLPFFTPLYLNNKKILGFIHEVTKEVVWHNPYVFPINIFVGFFASIIEPIVFKLFYKNVQFMTVSESTQDELNQWGVKNVKVIHNGVTLLKNNANYSKNKQKTIIYLGALARDKGIEDAISVMNKLIEKYPNWRCWVVGKADDKYFKKLKQLSSREIKYFGFVSDPKKFELLAKAHILLNPSAREGWGLVNIEANSVGTPVVGYNVSGMKDSVLNNKTGLLVEKGDTRKLLEQTEKLILDTNKYNNLSKNAVKWSQQFSWEKSTKESLKLIKSLI